MQTGKTLLNHDRLALAIERLCHQVLEDWGDFSNSCLIGIQPRGTLLSNRIHTRLQQLLDNKHIEPFCVAKPVFFDFGEVQHL